MILLGLPGCRKTPNFRDNLFLLLVTGICSAKWPLIARLFVYPFLRRADADFDNLQRADTSGLNAADIDYDILVFARRGCKRVQVDYC